MAEDPFVHLLGQRIDHDNDDVFDVFQCVSSTRSHTAITRGFR